MSVDLATLSVVQIVRCICKMLILEVGMPTRKKPKNGLIAMDLLILAGSYVGVAGLKPVMVSYLTPKYLLGFGITLFIWMISSFYFKKYHISRKERPTFLLRNVIYPNLVTLAIISFIIYAFNTTFYSRMMVLGTIGAATIIEIFFFSLYTYVLSSTIATSTRMRDLFGRQLSKSVVSYRNNILRNMWTWTM